MGDLGSVSYRVPQVGIVARDVGTTRKSNALHVEIVRKQKHPIRLDLEGGASAPDLGTVCLDQVSGRIRTLYAKWWGQLAGDSFYYPCRIPLPLQRVASAGITIKDERGDGARPIWDWVELLPRMRTVSRLAVLDLTLSEPRVGNPWNLRQPWEPLYWNGQAESKVVKATMVEVVTRVGISIPERCVDMYRELCHGFLRGNAKKNQVLYVAEAVQCLHHWRVPITLATVGEMAKYANGFDDVPSDKTIQTRIEAIGLVHTDTLSTGAWVYNYPIGHGPDIPAGISESFPHSREGYISRQTLSIDFSFSSYAGSNLPYCGTGVLHDNQCDKGAVTGRHV